MKRILCAASVLLGTVPLVSQVQPAAPPSFEVASIKPSAPDDRGGRYLTMQGAHQFVARNYTLKFMVMAAYNVPARGVTGGPPWTDSDRYDILATTPGETRPNLNQQFGGALPPANADTPAKPDLFAAMQQQLGLRLQSSRDNVDVIVIDRVERP